MTNIFLNKNTKAFLKSQLDPESRLAQSLLFYGEEHLGKFHAAKIFSKSILCENHIWNGCDKCNSCKAFNNNWHSDFKIWNSESDSIKIEDLLTLKDFLTYRPQLSKNRILIINNADKLTKEAESSLLKLLEEPSKDSIIILISSFSKKLLPTILSRLLPIRFTKEPEANLKTFLLENSKIKKEDLDFYLELGQNKIGEIVHLIENPEYFNEKINNIKTLVEILKNNFIDNTNIIKKITDKDTDLELVVKDWLGFLHQILIHNNLDLWEKHLKINLSFLNDDPNFLRRALRNALQLQNYTANYSLNKKLMLETFYLTIK